MTHTYYSKHGKTYIQNTLPLDMTEQYQLFQKHIPTNAIILDIGFGSGRDSLYFSKHYSVTSMDNNEIFVEEARKLLKNTVLLLDVKDLYFYKEFDGLWASASLLHIPSSELNRVFIKCSNALKDNGSMYVSFKYGEFEGFRDERYFTDMTLEKLHTFLLNTNFYIIEYSITDDVFGRDEQWLNVIFKKIN